MLFSDLSVNLKESFIQKHIHCEIDSFKIYQLPFSSNSAFVLPGENKRCCNIHDEHFEGLYNGDHIEEDVHHEVNVKDVDVEDNTQFNYYLLMPKTCTKVDKVVLLFHGFNEKSWDKYLSWGAIMVEKLQCGVVFFPLAFHMQRAPAAWSDKRKMFELSNLRKRQFPNVLNSTLSNAAISVRMQSLPQRFIWSGLQTYYDVIQWVKQMKNGGVEWIHPNASIDIFAYSIGGFLGEILTLTNHRDYFSKSKLCLFCSGPVFNRLSPVSKFILDSEANVALYSYLAEHFDAFLEKDKYLKHFMDGDHLEGKVFHSMLEFKRLRKYRESLLKKREKQIYAIGLKNDAVIPVFEMVNTLKGAYRDIHIKVDEMDFDFPYTHETPFPNHRDKKEEVNKAFEEVFGKVCDFLQD